MNNADRYNMTSAERDYVARNNKFIIKEMERIGAFEPIKREIEKSIRDEIHNASKESYSGSSQPAVRTEIVYLNQLTADELRARDEYLKEHSRKLYWSRVLFRIITLVVSWTIIIGIFMLLCNIPIIAILMEGFVRFIKSLFTIK